MRLTDLIETFKGHDKVIFKLTGIGGMEYNTVEFKDAIDTIEALHQENERLADETIKLMKENAKNSNKKDELVKVLKQARDAINGYSTCPYCWGVNGHAKGCKFYEALQNIDALIGGKEDAGKK